MKSKSFEMIFQTLAVFGIILGGSVAVQDQNPSDQTEMYGAYPGGLVAAQDQNPSDQTEMYGAYQGGLISATNPRQTAYANLGEPTSATNPEQIAYAYPAGLGPATMGASAATAIYSTNPPPANQQNVLLSYNTQAAPPEAVYYSGTYVPWATFHQTFPASSPLLWVATSGGWSWYATCPLGSWIQNLMYVPATGPIKLYELYPDGSTRLDSTAWTGPGYKYIWFYADTPGRHITVFTIYDNPSNYITIDVI
ncbi:MAG: hypothetical protein LUQ38_10150 [Methanotrichaceae archaeon]|nr:hypothetical protein [Methanotrichaceae archaeon]MDD1758693.1 hypothetical protein [Methanotrichaceae archaeon]